MSLTRILLERGRASVAGVMLAAAVFLAGSPSQATVVLSGTGTGVNPISAKAIFTFGSNAFANYLDITLVNTSTVPTQYPADVLTSFYFDIRAVAMSGTIRPTLTYEGASGQVYQVKSGTADVANLFTPPYTSGTAFTPGSGTSNLKAAINGDYSWQYKPMNTGSAPFFPYGVGTVGNSTTGTTGLLKDQYLVGGSITFRFSGVVGYGDQHVSPDAFFGFGTAPDAAIMLPEPGGLAACGLLAAALLGRLARPRTPRSLAVALGFAAVAAVILVAMPAAEAAAPAVGETFDFSDGPQGWTGTPVGKNGYLPPSDPARGARWTLGSGQWSVNWAPVNGPSVATGNYLTSGSIPASDLVEKATGLRAIDLIRISIAHKFNFGSFTGAVPPGAGQVVYSINDSPFVPIISAAWETGGVLAPVPPDPIGTPPLWPDHVGQTTLVAPTFTPPVGAYSDRFPLVNNGPTFIGSTPGYTPTGGTFVPSVAVIDLPPQEISNFRLRLINANLGSFCETGAGWDVGFIQVDFAAPEPDSFGLAAVGGLTLAAAIARNRRAPATPPVARAAPASPPRA